MNGFFKRHNTAGVVAGTTAAVVLILSAPQSPPDAPGRAVLPDEPLPRLAPEPVDVALPSPPILAADVLASSPRPLAFEARLPASVPATGITYGRVPLRETGEGPQLVVPSEGLRWGLNPIRLLGADQFGRPIDRARALLVGDTEAPESWIRGGLAVRLDREGFTDEDRLLDDLSDIAKGRVEATMNGLPPLEAGPIAVSNIRVGTVVVTLEPDDGKIRGQVMLRHNHADFDLPIFGRVRNLPIHRMWVDLEIAVRAGDDGRPEVEIGELEAHFDIVRTTSGAINWILDHAAWFAEIAGEVMTREPLRQALAQVLDEALSRWVDRFAFTTVAPLRAVDLEVVYRFAEIALTPDGLVAQIDFRATCEDPRVEPLGRMVHPVPADWNRQLRARAGQSVVQVGLHSDAINGVFDALWRCRALDTAVSFPEVAEGLALIVPSVAETWFRLPPVLQSDERGHMVVGVGDVAVDLTYPDLQYGVSATGLIPIALELRADGRALEVAFDAESPSLALYTDCTDVRGRPCHDNPLFDRLAWLAVPYMPPIGATIPLPDVRLGAEGADALSFRLQDLHWEGDEGVMVISGGYEVRSGE